MVFISLELPIIYSVFLYIIQVVSGNKCCLNQCIIKILLINSLGYKVLMVTSVIKHAFKCKTLTEFSMTVDSKKNILNL